MYRCKHISKYMYTRTLGPLAPGKHFDLSCCSRKTFRPVLLLRDDISTCPAAHGRHFDACCSSDDISTCPAAPTSRPVLLLRDDISTCPVALRYFDLLCYARTTFRLVLLLPDDISTLALGRQLSNCLLEVVFEIVGRSLVKIIFEILFEACDRYAHFMFR